MHAAQLAHLLAALPQDKADLVVRLSDCYRETGHLLGALGIELPQSGPISLPGPPSYPALPAASTDDLTLGALIARNLEDIQRTTKPAGHHAHTCHAKMWTELWGDRPAMSITRADLEQWALGRAQTHSQSTVLHELQSLRRAYNLAVYHEWLPRNPIKGARIKLKMGRRHQILSPGDERKLAETYFANKKGELWVIEEFALLTGVRIGEQVRLETSHVQGAGTILKIPDDGKTGSRLVPLCKRAREIAAQAQASASSKWLFWSRAKNDNRLTVAASHVKWVWRVMCKAANLAGYQRRDLRRTFASRLIAKGVPIFEVQRLLGHTDTKTTQIYAHVGIDQLSQAISLFDEED